MRQLALAPAMEPATELAQALAPAMAPAPAQALFAQMENAGIAADVVTHTLLLRALATHPTRS